MDKHQKEHHDTQTPKCRICKDSGISYYGEYISQGIGIVPHRYCQCDTGKGMYEQWLNLPETIKQIQNEREKEFSRLLKASKIPPKFSHFSLSSIEENPGLFSIINRFIEQHPTGRGLGLYLWGEVGAGKTTTACIAGKELIRQYLEDVYMINWADAISMIKASFDSKKDHPGSRIIQQLKNCSVLILDDIHQEKGSDWVREQLFITINYRYENNKPIILTSNFPIEDIGDRYGPQISSRLLEMCKVIQFTGEDRRGHQRSIF